ncbi:MAG: serine hydrolase domain-containing protein [Liquorilactobacillus nagelii]
MKKFYAVLMTTILLGLMGFVLVGGFFKYKNSVRAGQEKPVTSKHLQQLTYTRDGIKFVNHEPAEKVDSLPSVEKTAIQKQLDKNKFSGTCLLVKNGKIIYLQAFGNANNTTGKLNQINSVYPINSIQKGLTAYLIMQLIQEHRLNFTDKIGKFYPKIPGGQTVTIRDMLNMCSGYQLPKQMNYLASDEGVLKYNLSHLKYSSQQLEKFNYQEVNYTLLAGVVTKLTGTSYEKLIKQKIIDKLNLTNTGFMCLNNPQQPIGYNFNNNQWQAQKIKQYEISREFGASNIYMSVWDLYQSLAALRNGTLLSSQSKAELYQTTSKDPYVAGMYPLTQFNRIHGIGFGFESSVAMSSTGQDAVVLLTNHWNSKAAIQTTLTSQLYQIINPA